MYIGNVFSLLVTPIIINSLGWREGFIFFPILTIIWGIFFSIFTVSDPSLPLPLKFFQMNPIERDYILHTRRKLKEGYVPFPWVKVMTSFPIWSLFICNFCSNWGVYVYLNWLPTYLKDGLGYDLSNTGIYSTIAYLLMFILSTLGKK